MSPYYEAKQDALKCVGWDPLRQMLRRLKRSVGWPYILNSYCRSWAIAHYYQLKYLVCVLSSFLLQHVSSGKQRCLNAKYLALDVNLLHYADVLHWHDSCRKNDRSNVYRDQLVYLATAQIRRPVCCDCWFTNVVAFSNLAKIYDRHSSFQNTDDEAFIVCCEHNCWHNDMSTYCGLIVTYEQLRAGLSVADEQWTGHQISSSANTELKCYVLLTVLSILGAHRPATWSHLLTITSDVVANAAIHCRGVSQSSLAMRQLTVKVSNTIATIASLPRRQLSPFTSILTV